MPKQFAGQLCVLCRARPSSTKAEHVWPDWFLSLFPKGDGPYTRFISGQLKLKRDGVTVRTHTDIESDEAETLDVWRVKTWLLPAHPPLEARYRDDPLNVGTWPRSLMASTPGSSPINGRQLG